MKNLVFTILACLLAAGVFAQWSTDPKFFQKILLFKIGLNRGIIPFISPPSGVGTLSRSFVIPTKAGFPRTIC